MSYAIGLDIGGTKIAGAAYDEAGHEIRRVVEPVPTDYQTFLNVCANIIERLDKACGEKASVGIGVPGPVTDSDGVMPTITNIPHLTGKPFKSDIQNLIKRPVKLANDANCAALAEACEGAGRGFHNVFGMILGTGVGGAWVVNGQIFTGANGLTGEIGHLPLPFLSEDDTDAIESGSGQFGMLEDMVSGAGLKRLYQSETGHGLEPPEIAEAARNGDVKATAVLDKYYHRVAKAMVTIIHAVDPDIIVVSGGLSGLPGLVEKVPQYWGQYALREKLKTRFVQAQLGPMSGMRGAALL